MKFIPLIVFFLVVGCASQVSHAPVMVHDIEFCADLGPAGAECDTTLSHKSRSIEKDQWDDERVGQLCTKSQGFKDIFVTEEQLCTELKVCDYDDQQQVMDLEKQIQTVIKKGQRARKKYDQE